MSRLSRQRTGTAPQLTALEGGGVGRSSGAALHAPTLRLVGEPTPREAGEREARRRFRAARLAAGLTQLEAAHRLGVGSTSLEDWERGAARLPAWALVELEAAAHRRAA